LASSPSIKINVASNFIAQTYVMGIGIVMAPVYLSFIGPEAYGLIGFFTMLSAWFVLLDIGLTPTMVRETARYHGGAIGIDTLRIFLRSLEAIFGVVAVIGAIMMVSFAHDIATRWLVVKHLPIEEVTEALTLMGLTMPLRWISGLYRGVMVGLERQVWLGGYNIAIATARFVGVLTIFWTFGPTPVNFFAYQLVVAIAELVGLMIAVYRLMRRGSGTAAPFTWAPLIGNLKFSITIAFTATAWVVIMQSDKLILSKLLPLAEYGMFSIAVVAANAVNAINAPFNQAILPRLTKLASQNDDARTVKFYRNGTQAVCTVMGSAVAALCFFSHAVVFAWTGNTDVARYAAPIVCLYAIGNGCVSLHSFAYYIQYAKGDLYLHFLGHALMLLVLVPLFITGAVYYGATGTGVAWMLVNGLYALCWMPLVHARVLKGLHWIWLTRDVFPIIVPTVLCGWLLSTVMPVPTSRLGATETAIFAGIVLFAVAVAGSSAVRGFFQDLFERWLASPSAALLHNAKAREQRHH
jgi:O-antigen/teichoic acid export membrane protein